MIYGAPPRTPSLPLFKALDVLNLNELYDYNVGLLMYKLHHSMLPSTISELFLLNKDFHNYFTRQSHLIHPPKVSTVLGKTSFKYNASLLWNKIMVALDVNNKIGTFKKHMKSFLLQEIK